MVDFEYRVYDEVLNDMKKGIKKIEIRLYNDKSSKIQVGNTIKFKVLGNEEKFIIVKVINLIIYEDVNDLLDKYDLKMATKKYNEKNIIDGLKQIFGEYEATTHKIIGIEFEIMEDSNGIKYN